MRKSQEEANRRWAENHKEHNRYLKYRSTTRTFIRKYSAIDDLDEIQELIKERRKEL